MAIYQCPLTRSPTISAPLVVRPMLQGAALGVALGAVVQQLLPKEDAAEASEPG